MKKRTLLALFMIFAMTLFVVACGDDGDDTADGDVTDGDTEQVDGDTTDGTTQACQWANPDDTTKVVGEPCEEDEECLSNFCLTTDTLAPLVDGSEMPGGYCTALMIAEFKQCLCDPNGVWISLAPWTGMINQGICLVPCVSDDDCRVDEGYKCFEPDELFGDWSEYEACVEPLYRGKTGCLHESLIEAAFADPPKPEDISCDE